MKWTCFVRYFGLLVDMFCLVVLLGFFGSYLYIYIYMGKFAVRFVFFCRSHRIGWTGEVEHETCCLRHTPRKINGSNLIIHRWKRKTIFHFPPFSGSMCSSGVYL